MDQEPSVLTINRPFSLVARKQSTHYHYCWLTAIQYRHKPPTFQLLLPFCGGSWYTERILQRWVKEPSVLTRGIRCLIWVITTEE
jgi:hypothetical protein